MRICVSNPRMMEKECNGGRDCLVKNISTAIKQIHVESCKSTNEVAVCFTGNMWQVQELCLHLDRIFSHGLKNASCGYWPFVKELTHRSTVDYILGLPRAVTNVVRAWAWLYLTLNEQTMESYLRTVIEQPKLVQKHYLPGALLRDNQSLQMLIMMTSGLEHISFSLEPETACLMNWQSVIDDGVSDNEADDTSENASVCDVHDISEDFTHLDVSAVITSEDVDDVACSEEIVHSSARAMNRCHKQREKIHLNNNDEDFVRADAEREVHVGSGENISQREFLLSMITDTKEMQDKQEFVLNYILTSHRSDLSDMPFSEPRVLAIADHSSELRTVLTDSEEQSACCSASFSGEELGVKLREKTTKDPNAVTKRVSFDPNNMVSVFNATTPDNISTLWPTEDCVNARGEILQLGERGVPEGQEDPMSSSFTSIQPRNQAAVNGVNLNVGCKSLPSPSAIDESVRRATCKAVDDEIDHELKLAAGGNEASKLLEGEVPLENNFHLLLMLEVIDEPEEEKVYKVFEATFGYTCGTPLEIKVVLTDRRIYLIHSDQSGVHNTVDASVSFVDIEFIQLSINYQVINVVCCQPRRRYWICTGNEEVSRNLISSLEFAMRRCPKVTRLPVIFTDSTAQAILLSKWISEDIGVDPHQVNVDYYALVKWEDPHLAQKQSAFGGPAKEGFLMYRYIGDATFGINQWRPGYFRLKAGVCYLYMDPLDRTFKSYVKLMGGGCVGCRRVNIDDRPHAFEVILSDRRTLQLAAPSDMDASDWLQCILHSVSFDREQLDVPLCVSACLIQAHQKFFICHEQLETNTLSILGKAELQDVSCILLNPNDAPYCILVSQQEIGILKLQEFELVEAVESSGDWVLYFSSKKELDKFVEFLKSSWHSLYQIPLPCYKIGDPLLKKCCVN